MAYPFEGFSHLLTVQEQIELLLMNRQGEYEKPLESWQGVFMMPVARASFFSIPPALL